MNTTTFRTLGNAASVVVGHVEFLRELDYFSLCDDADIPRIAPPVNALPDPTCDENAELAGIFVRLCRLRQTSDRMSLLTAEIIVHGRRLDMAWDKARGTADPRQRADRTDWVALKPYQAMIEVLRDWLDALHDRATADK